MDKSYDLYQKNGIYLFCYGKTQHISIKYGIFLGLYQQTFSI